MDAQRDDAPESLRSLRDTPSERMRVALRQSDAPASHERPRSEIAANIDDGALVERIRAGDRHAEAELYRRCAPPIARVVERLLRSSHDAQDVLQDTFVSALENIGRLREPAAVRVWLMQIAVRQVHRRFRRRRLRKILGFDDPEPDARLDQLAAEGAPPEAIAELALLDRALMSANAPDRAAWMLRRVEGYALEEVASLCSCSLATAKRRVAAADALVGRFLEGPLP